ncbi:type II toxin-antitoxin system VapC family toxin [Streptomyces sp. MAR4 CNX-425]|uniref:type II toxin-antitoxin system VapC family toxin n=1 Tax=Streptomyces sp. MAR4 CNX-425 TaxID=3406343 RepID=UPI003B509ABD
MIVLDNSALVDYLVGTTKLADQVRAKVTGHRLAAPYAVDLECASTLRGLVRGNKLPAQEAKRALDLLGRIPMRRYAHVPLLPRIWELRHNMWPYDASYVALAETLGADLVTVDAKMAAVPGMTCTVLNLRQ